MHISILGQNFLSKLKNSIKNIFSTTGAEFLEDIKIAKNQDWVEIFKRISKNPTVELQLQQIRITEVLHWGRNFEKKSQNFWQYSEEHSIRHQRSTLCKIMDTDQPPLQTNYFSLNVENTGTYTKAISTINIPFLSPRNDTRTFEQGGWPNYYIPSSFNNEVALCLRTRLPWLYYAPNNIRLEELNRCMCPKKCIIACARRNAL